MNPRDYLASLEFFGVKLGLESITRLLNALGNPQQTYPAIHVAGTNGKGSVLAYLDAMFRAAGYRDGKFTSPHLIDVSERFQINGVPISNDDLDDAIQRIREIVQNDQHPPTYFEVNTAIAFDYFKTQAVDVALIEVGMGGRFDSTNVLNPEVTAVTTIAYDHQKYLGDTLEKIAFEKAGIVKPDVPVVIGENKGGPLGVLLDVAAKLDSPAYVLGRDFRYTLEGTVTEQRITFEGRSMSLSDAPLSLAGSHQGANAAVALALAEILVDSFPKLDENAIREGLRNAKWPCRIEKVLEAPPFWLDATHNTAGAEALAQTFPRAVFIVAVSSDKDAKGIVNALAPHAAHFVFTRFKGNRAMPIEDLERAAGPVPHTVCPAVDEAIQAGINLGSEELPVVLTGSIFAVGEARRILVDDYGAPDLAF